MSKFELEKLSKQSRIVAFLVFAIIILQNPIWPLWSFPGFDLFVFPTLLFYFLVACLFFYLLKLRRRFVANTLFLLSFFGCCFIFIVWAFIAGFNGSSVLILLTFLLPLALKNEEKVKVIDWLTKYLGLVLLISCSAWLIHHYLISLPMWGTFNGSALKGGHYLYGNYLFFVEIIESHVGDNVRYISENDFHRFYSMFDEPGVTGALSAFILFANRYDWRNKWVVIIFVTNLFTYSIAFYLLVFISLLFLYADTLKRFLAVIAIGGCIGALGIFLFRNNEVVQALLFNRLLDLGGDSLNERTDYRLVQYISSSSFLQSWNLFLGIGTDAFARQEYVGNSWLFFFLKYGICGLISVIGVYLSFLGKWNKNRLFLMLLFLLSFLNRPFLFSSWQILLFVCISAVFATDDKIIYKKSMN